MPNLRESIFIEPFHLHLSSTPPEKERVIGTRGLRVHTENIIDMEDLLDPVYPAKAKILNDASQEIGMGRYQVLVRLYPPLSQLLHVSQWRLFFVVGFGFFS